MNDTAGNMKSGIFPLFYTAPQFAQHIGVTPTTVRRWDKEGILKPHHCSPKGTRYYSADQLKEYLEGSQY